LNEANNAHHAREEQPRRTADTVLIAQTLEVPMTSATLITIVIPTTCSADRRESLLRAVQSAHAASCQPIAVLVVVNGNRVDADTLGELNEQPVQVDRQQEGSLPKALARGRSLVQTPFFGFLDDDDELLSGALDRRLALMLADSRLGLVVSNGYRELEGKRSSAVSSLEGVDREPLRQLLANNWLASCAGLYRTSMVSAAYFERLHAFAEWTWLGYRLCLAGTQVGVVQEHGFVVHDTPGSLSKSADYHRSYVALFDRMLAENPPLWARKALLVKRCSVLHDLSVKALQNGELAMSWQLHLRSLGSPHGWRYLPYTRHLVSRALGFAKSS
jgi:hypothetical protein